jgi:hypothetical protein
MKTGSLNLLEPSGTVQACTGIALHFNFSKCVIISTHFRIYCVQTKTNYIQLPEIELSVISTVNRTGFTQNQITSNMFIKKCDQMQRFVIQ